MIRILYIEDDPFDHQLLARHLQRQGMAAELVRVEDAAGLARALEQGPWDAVVTDHKVPRLDFRETLALLCRRLPDCPIILVSGSVGEETAVELLKQGLWDFVLKDRLARLCPALERGMRDALERRARRAAEQALQASEARFRAIADSISEVIWMADVESGLVTYASPAYETIWQRNCASLYADPHSYLDSVHPDDRARVAAEVRAAQAAARPYEHAYRIVRPDGGVRWILQRGVPAAAAPGQPARYVGVAEDVTQRHLAEERLRQAAAVFESTQEGVMITGLDARLLAVNRAFSDISGYSEREALGQTPALLHSGRHGPEFFQAMWASLLHSGQWQGEVWNRRKDGEIYPAWTTISTVRDQHGAPAHYVSVFSDISQLQRSREALAHLVHYDPLTELPNRLLLQSRLEHAIDRAGRHGKRCALLFIDLDHFKTINDSLGHVAGDQLLREAAGRLRARVRGEDTLGRFGGDEFLLLLEPLGAPEAAAIVARELLAALAAPFRLAGHSEVYVGASIGISIFPDDGASAADLLRDAEAAMYRAKQHGRNRFCFYTADMNADAVAQLELEAALRRALERGEFLLHYQAKVDLRSGALAGAEALIRWRREDGALEMPARFIGLAEKTGLIVPIGDWVIDSACRQLRDWRAAGWGALRLAVNVSAQQFYSGDLTAVVEQALARHQVPAANLELELTESMLMVDPGQTIAILRALKGIGVQLSLDDFGTGYSSFSYLSRFPIDTLKIDQSFVRDIVTEPEAAMIAVAIIDLAHRMRLKVVAEGVETEAQLGYLRAHGCDEMQGYYFARPLPAEAFAALLRERRALPAPAPAADGRTLLLVEPGAAARAALAAALEGENWRILSAAGAGEGLELLARHAVQVVLCGPDLAPMAGRDFLGRVRDIHPDTVRIALRGTGGAEAAHETIAHPCQDARLRQRVRAAFLRHPGARQSLL